jgi:Zn-finger protein
VKNSYRFFANKSCKYYPCHEGIEDMNCLFCFCPFYTQSRCPGKPEYVKTKEGKQMKDCTNCTFPHRPESYDVIIKWLSKAGQRESENGKQRDHGTSAE